MNTPMRIVLDQLAPEALTASGERVFKVIGPASSSDDPTHWVLALRACREQPDGASKFQGAGG